MSEPKPAETIEPTATEAPFVIKGEEKLEKVEHKTIYAALAAFQGENLKIARTKHVDYSTKGGDKVDYWYAPLDEILQVIRPYTSRHGIAVTWEPKAEGQMVCTLYHETYELKYEETDITVTKKLPDGTEEVTESVTRTPVEKNVIRSMPIKVKRDGDMKTIGTDSTYARRYTLAEVLGISPDEDNDTKLEEERLEKVEKTGAKQIMNRIENAKDLKTLKEQTDFFEKMIIVLDTGKWEGKPATEALGFKKQQYEEFLTVADMKKTQLEEELAGGNQEGGSIGGNTAN